MDQGLNQQTNHLDNQISLTPFKYKHLQLLLDMLKDRDFIHISKINMKSLPKIGYIALLHDQPIAAGFLRKVEGGYGQMDTLTSNPFFGSQIRNEGIRLVVDELFKSAKEEGMVSIVSFTSDLGILERSQGLGFKVLEHSVIGIALK